MRKGTMKARWLCRSPSMTRKQEVLVTVPVVVVDVATRVDAFWGLQANLVLWLGFVGACAVGRTVCGGRVVEGK